MSEQDPAWSGRLAFGPWWLLYSGPVGPTNPHAHHAYQLLVHGGAPFVVDEHRQPLPGPVVVIEPGQTHALVDRRQHVIIAYIDPESSVGRRLQQPRTPAESTSNAHPVSAVLGALRPDNWSRAEEAVQRIVGLLCGTWEATPMTWWRHPAIDAALRRLPALADEGAVDVGVLAEEVGLSVSRLTHVFSEEVGMPIRSYVRWMRLVNAMEHLSVGGTITAAAHTAGFADGAHFSRTFKEMFGLSPSEAVGLGKWMAS